MRPGNLPLTRGLRDRVARRRLDQQLRSPHYQAALSAGADLRRERSDAIRRAERLARMAFYVATAASLTAAAVMLGAIGAVLGWWS